MQLFRVGEGERSLLWRALLLALGVRVGLLLVAYLAVRVILERQGPLGNLLQEVFSRWDAPHYLRIAEVGYRAEGEDRLFLVFFPLYPIAVRLAHYVIPNFVLAGMAVSLVASVAAGFFLQALARLDSDDDEAGRALWYFFLFPTAYFLVVPYAEALFLALVLASYLSARQGRWAWSGVAGMLACATRLQGLALVPALALEAFGREGRAAPLRAFWLLLVPIGFLAYLAINRQVLGDPFAFVEIQRTHWFHEAVPPWEPLVEAVRSIMNDPPSALRTTIFEARLAAFVFAAALLASSVRWLRPSYQVYAWGGLIFLMSVSWQISLPRYLLALFPLFLILARIGRRQALHQALLAVSAVFMSGLFVLYALGRWAF
ncbi:MAG: mannosyltransferase family protein [Dehalococcoidia bacterium]